jgi:hypothetical protein
MNNIGVGIFCFGEDYYFKGTKEKIEELVKRNIPVYILTNETEKFSDYFVNVVEYVRDFKSYYDKMILSKYILKHHDYCILLDADTHITDYSVFDIIKIYQFKYGITYIDTLLSHSAKREFVKDLINIDQPEWAPYITYVNKLYPNYKEFETLWEYFLVINKVGFNSNKFFHHYERLQVAKEFSDLCLIKEINGAGEGISLSVSAKLSESDIQRDVELYDLLKDKMISISRRHTPPHLWPTWMV